MFNKNFRFIISSSSLIQNMKSISLSIHLPIANTNGVFLGRSYIGYLFLKFKIMSKKEEATPGDGIRSMKTSRVFRVVNFELYAKPNMYIMGLGAIALTFSVCYIAYMRYKYESMGYYTAVDEEGKEVFKMKKSKWD